LQVLRAWPLHDLLCQVIEFLINKGADPNIKDRFGGSALLDAMKSNHVETMAYLKKKGAGKESTGCGYYHPGF